MPNPKLEDLRKKAFLLYAGPKGPELVNKEIKKLGIKEDKLNEYQLKILLNNVIKTVFIDFVGLEATKKALAQDVTHVPGYHTFIEEESEPIHILERFRFMRWVVAFLALSIVGVLFLGGYYMLSFDREGLCDNKKDVDGRDACYLSLASSRGNVSFCDSLSVSNRRYNCYSLIGRKLNDTLICDRIPGNDVGLIVMHDNCLMCVAVSLKNGSMCKSFHNPITVDECLSQMDRAISLSC
ncbi:MAG: hypothetical protein V1875_00700 [Candidatus Altiarchaeota archaeon]